MAPSLSRRAVLRGLGASAASLVLPLRTGVVTASDPPVVCAGYRPCVATGWVPAGEPGALERAVRRVVDAATDFAWLAPGDRVLVKVASRSEEHTSELQSLTNLVCRLLLEKKKKYRKPTT